MRVGNEVAAYDGALGGVAVGLLEAIQLADRPDVRSSEQGLDVGLGFFGRKRALEDRGVGRDSARRR